MKRCALYVLKGILLLCLSWGVGLLYFVYLIPFYPPKPTVATDGMVIFTGGKTRLKTALSLFQQKKSKYLLISGANPESPSKDIVGQSPVIPEITLGYEALNTSGNAKETAAWVKENHIKTLRLITSNYHMPRSLFELRHLLPDVKIFPQPVIGSRFSKVFWWTHRPTLFLVVQEYHKFLYVFFRHFYRDTRKSLDNETLG